MSSLSQLKQAGLPITAIETVDTSTQGEEYGTPGRGAELTTGELTAVQVISAAWSSGPTQAQRDTFRAVMGPGYILDDEWTGASSEVTYTVTVPSGTVGSDLTDYPLMIELSDMPATFWDDVRSDGGNVRVYDSDGSTLIPHDLTHIDTAREVGRLFAKKTISAASDTTVVVKVLEATETALDVTDTNGRNAVWSDYEVVMVFPDDTNRTGVVNTRDVADLEPHTYWARTGYSSLTPGNPHQGIAVDGTSVVTLDTNYLRRVTTSDLVTVLASNADPVGDVNTAESEALLNHVSDGFILSGELWVPVDEYPKTVSNVEYLAVFDSTTLAYKRSYDVSAQGRYHSSICYNPTDGLIYATDYDDGSSLMIYNTSGAYQGTLVLTQTLVKPQGICIVDGVFYVSCETTDNPLYEVAFDGTVTATPIYYHPHAGINEGIDYDGTTLWHMDGDGDITQLQQLDQTFDFRKIHYADVYERTTLSTVWSAGVSVYWTADDLQQAFLALANGTGSADRASLAYDEGPDVIGTWNSTDSWLWSADTPSLYTSRRLALAHNGTTERKLASDGVVTTDAPIAARPTGAGSMDLVLNASSSSGSENGEGYYQFAWLRADYVSSDWLEADALNMNNPTGFYTIT